MPVSCLVVTSRDETGFSAADKVSCLFSFKSILLHTSGKCQSIKRTACMLNFIYIGQSKWYLRLKISVQGPFKSFPSQYKIESILSTIVLALCWPSCLKVVKPASAMSTVNTYSRAPQLRRALEFLQLFQGQVTAATRSGQTVMIHTLPCNWQKTSSPVTGEVICKVYTGKHYC